MNGFAGSVRAAERRRRRLAVESEGFDDALPNAVTLGTSESRSSDQAGREAAQLTAHNCPILTVVSARAWKHWAVAFLGAAAAGFVLLAGHWWPHWAPGFGPGLTRLFKSTASPLLTWMYTLELFLTAQAACLVWWARSRSLGDFHGNYRIWAWAAGTWLFFSFAVATNAHLAWSETLLFHVHWKNRGAALLCWLLPVAAWGWGMAFRLEPELREDRQGHFLFLAAGGWYLAVAAVLCQIEFYPKFCPPALSQLVLASCQILAHATFFLSTSLHLKYVLFCSAEPPQRPAKRRAAPKKADVPAETETPRRGWLSRLLGLGMDSEETNPTGDESGPTPKERKRTPAKKKTASRKATRKTLAEPEAEWEDPESESEEEVNSNTENLESVAESEVASDKQYRFDPAESSDEESDGDEEDAEFKGLSKRERRKLQAQKREEERRTRR